MAIKINPHKKGLLHRKLHVPQGQNIPVAKLEKATHSKSPALRSEAQFALNARHFRKK